MSQHVRVWQASIIGHLVIIVILLPRGTDIHSGINNLAGKYETNSGMAKTRQDPVDQRCLGRQWC